MPTHAVVWDLETVPNLKGFAAANDLVSKSDDEIREARRFGSFATDPFSAVAIGCIADNGRHWRKADIAVFVWIDERGPPTGAALVCLKAALDSYRARLAIIETAFAHKDHPLAVVFLRQDGAEPHMAATRGASNDRKYKLVGYVR